MIRRALTVAAVAGALAAIPAPAQAAGCVTKTEYRAIANGMSIGYVIRMTGAQPTSVITYRAADGYRRDVWSFRTCPHARKSWGRTITVRTMDGPVWIFRVIGKTT